MSVQISTSLGSITVSNEVISDIVGVTTLECPGVVGMASQKRLKDGVSELLKRENYSKGIIIRNEDNDIHIDLHVVVLFGVKISEIASTVQERIKHTLEQIIGLSVSSINIIIEDVKVEGN